MLKHAKGTFRVMSWDEKTYEEIEEGGKLTRARITQDFSGDLEATGTWEALMCYRRDGTAIFTGFQRIAGRIGGRSGSFVLEANGTYDGNEARSNWLVVAGCGSGELRELSGTGAFAAPHGPNGSFTLDYELD